MQSTTRNLHVMLLSTEWHKKTGTFEKPNKNWRNQKKKNVLTETEPLQLAFYERMQHTQGDTKERELLKCVVAVKEEDAIYRT